MGANMARCLKDAGYDVTAVYDSNSKIAEDLAKELSCSAPSELSAVTAAADVVFTVVSDDAAMKAIFSDGLLESAKGKLFINCATLSPKSFEDVADKVSSAGAESLEACMASSITQAREGTLYLMIGGKEETFNSQRELLDTLSADLSYIGPTGSAAKVKALVNMVMNINTAALAEGLGLGKALGLDLNLLTKVFSQTGANSRVLETDSEDMIDRDHECYFSAAHAAKDSGIANELAKSAGVEVPLSEATQKQYQSLIELGKGELDKSAVSELTFPGRRDS